MGLFTTDGRYVYYDSQLEGLSGEALASHIERKGGTYTSVRAGNPLIIERLNAYYVAQKRQPQAAGSREYFELSTREAR